jgi:hypothetical protein
MIQKDKYRATSVSPNALYDKITREQKIQILESTLTELYRLRENVKARRFGAYPGLCSILRECTDNVLYPVSYKIIPIELFTNNNAIKFNARKVDSDDYMNYWWNNYAQDDPNLPYPVYDYENRINFVTWMLFQYLDNPALNPDLNPHHHESNT